MELAQARWGEAVLLPPPQASLSPSEHSLSAAARGRGQLRGRVPSFALTP